VGAVYGAAMFVNAIAMGVGPFLTGLIHDFTGTYTMPFWVSGTIAAAGTFLAIGLREPVPPPAQGAPLAGEEEGADRQPMMAGAR
jgi:hypothetical protein